MNGFDKFTRDLYSDVEKYIRNVAKEITEQATEDLANEYVSLIDMFYDEYIPKVYIRHANRGGKGGLYKTFRKLKSYPNYTYFGGIEITARYMYTDYAADSNTVLSSFLNGYHGSPSLGIASHIPDPLWHMEKYRDAMVFEIDRYIDVGHKKARLDSYKLLKF